MKNFQRLLFPYALVFYEAILYLSNDMYLPSLPNIARDLNTSQDMVQYTLSLWFLGTCSLQLFLSPLSDYFGRRLILIWGSLLFLISTVLCALAQNIETLLVARFLQGSVVGTVTVAGYAAIHELYESKRTVQLLSLMASIIILAPAVGPILGAIVMEYTSWRIIFGVLALAGMGGILGIYFFMPKDLLRRKITLRHVVEQYRDLLSNKLFMKYTLAFCIILSSFFIWIVEGPFVVIEGLKKHPSVFGWAQAFIFGFFGVGAQVAKWLIMRKPVSFLIRLSILIILVGALLFIVTSAISDTLWVVIPSIMLISLGASMSFGSLNRLAIESSSVRMVTRTAMISLMVSAVGTFASFVMTLFNNRTFLNLSLVMGAFLLVGCLLIFRGSKGIKFVDPS